MKTLYNHYSVDFKIAYEQKTLLTPGLVLQARLCAFGSEGFSFGREAWLYRGIWPLHGIRTLHVSGFDCRASKVLHIVAAAGRINHKFVVTCGFGGSVWILSYGSNSR